MSAVSFSSAALKIAAIEIEMTNQQQAADHAARDAARQAKLTEMRAEESALADQADALLQEAVVGGALRVAGGVATFAAGTSELEAAKAQDRAATQLSKEQTPGMSELEAAEAQDRAATQLRKEQIAAKSEALNARLLASGFDGAGHASGKISEARCKSLESRAAQHRRLAEQASNAVEDQNDAIRRREEQFTQKLAVLQDALRSDQETARVIVRA